MAEHDPYPPTGVNSADAGKAATAAPPPPATHRRPAEDDDGPDPLASLHKMSTTAGLTYGAQEYVAVNVTSVVAVLLAAVGALSLMVDILLVIPIAAVIVAIVALRQISDSNGTQTGRGLAFLAILLSVVFAGIVGTRKLMEASQLRQDSRQIGALIEKLGETVKAEKWQEAYDMFSPRFQKRVNLQAFTDRWKAIQSTQYMGGKIKSMKGNGLLEMGVDPQASEPLAGTMLIMASDDPSLGEARQEMLFVKTGGQWKIENIPAIFPVAAPAAR